MTATPSDHKEALGAPAPAGAEGEGGPAPAVRESADPRPDWRVRFRREDRREFRYHLSILMAWAFSWFAWSLPRPVRNWIADRCGDLFYRRGQTYRRNVEANLRQVVGPEVPQADLERMAISVFRTSSRNFLDLLLAPHLTQEKIVKDVRLVSGTWDWLDEARQRGKGFVLFTAHLGAFDYIGQMLAAREYRMSVVTGRTTSRFIFDGVSYLRASGGLQVVEATPSGVRRILQALRRGEGAGILTDRDFFQNGKPVVLFGRATTLPPGPVRIARDTGAPLIGCFARRVGNGYTVSLTEPFYVPKTNDMEADIAAGLAQVVTSLEAAISESPEQWVMFQEAWPSAPAEPLRVFPVGSPLESELLERVVSALPERPRRSSERSQGNS